MNVPMTIAPWQLCHASDIGKAKSRDFTLEEFGPTESEAVGHAAAARRPEGE